MNPQLNKILVLLNNSQREGEISVERLNQALYEVELYQETLSLVCQLNSK